MTDKGMLFGFGALGILALAFAASRAKAASEGPPAPDSPDPSTEPPVSSLPLTRLPSANPEYEPPVSSMPPGGGGASSPPPPQSSVLPDPILDPPVSSLPLTSVPVTLDPPSLQTQPSKNPPPAMPIYPVTAPPNAPAAKPAVTTPIKTPFGDKPIDVPATAANVAPPPAAKRSAAQAATDLLAYVTPILAAKRGAELGVKGKPNALVKAAQLDMGVQPADGIYGPLTRTRGKALINKTFPVRV